MAICAFAITRKKDKILLVRIAPPFAESGKWNFPGGVIEDGEDIRAGLAREVFEETGVSCSIGKIRDNFTTENPDNDISIFDTMYIQGDIVIQEEEILEAQWLTVSDALNLELAFNIREYISKL
jgi:8-oxo-dGTP diphosphatase